MKQQSFGHVVEIQLLDNDLHVLDARPYINLYGYAPAESEIAQALFVMPPSANQMIRALEQRGFISRVPGTARSIKIPLPEDEIPIWNRGNVKPNPKATADKPGSRKRSSWLCRLGL